jgi:hypothetical protein
LEWNDINDGLITIPINTNLLITDGDEVFVGFYDSMHDWHMIDQEYCEDLQFDVTHWMEFPDPPK